MPFHNPGAHLRPAIESILAQTEGRYELLGLDDGSTDSSAARFSTYAQNDSRLRLVSYPRQGLVATLNAGIALARAAFLARMDADDIALPSRFALQLDYLERHPNCVVLGTGLRELWPDGRRIDITLPRQYSYEPTAAPQNIEIAHPTTMIRRAAIIRLGGYRVAFQHAEDADLWLRMLEIGDIANLPEQLLEYRLHPGQVSSRHAATQALHAKVARALALARANTGEPDWDDGVPLTPLSIEQLAGKCAPPVAARLQRGLAAFHLHREAGSDHLRASAHLRLAATCDPASVREPEAWQLLWDTVSHAVRRRNIGTALALLGLAMTASPLRTSQRVAGWLGRRMRLVAAAPSAATPAE
jgi:hypothetical protein